MTDTRDLIASWPADPAERLRATLDMYPNRKDDDFVTEAAYDSGQRVGLTFRDLRAIADRLGA